MLREWRARRLERKLRGAQADQRTAQLQLFLEPFSPEIAERYSSSIRLVARTASKLSKLRKLS